jgi:hypothetical protein
MLVGLLSSLQHLSRWRREKSAKQIDRYKSLAPAIDAVLPAFAP